MSLDPDDLRRRVHQELLQSVPGDSSVDRVAVMNVVTRVAPLLDANATAKLVQNVLADVHGLGPLDVFIADPSVSDIMVVGERGVWIERSGRVEDTNVCLSADETLHLIERIVSPLGLRVDRASPMVDARLPDGSRVNIIVPPLAVDGPCLTIRRFGAKPVPLSAFGEKSVTDLLLQAVTDRRNVLISGGTGTGKTTLLNAMAQGIGSHERVITIEDAAELRISAKHVVRLESRPANAEGIGRTTLRELVRNALRMRPDRIILGEVRGAEALDMLQAMNTGHEGSLSTCHANSPLDALARVETMVLMADVDLPLPAIRQQIASSIDVVVQIRRFPDGRRLITQVSEIERERSELRVVDVVNHFTRESRFLQVAS
jgi:pilus assembly protein CpaF